MYVQSFNAIIFSDLHLGFEEAVARGLDYTGGKTSHTYGMFIPRIQFKRVREVLDYVFSVVKPSKVIINGDVKHAFDRLLRQEREEVKKLIEYLLERGVKDIVIIRGNHDNFLPIVLKDYGLELYLKYELVTSRYSMLITHGHLELDVEGYDIVVIGHEHPSLRCLSSFRLPAILKIPFREQSGLKKYIVCLPAMGPYHPGTHVSADPSSYLSPIIQKYGRPSEAGVLVWLDLGRSIDGEDLLYPGSLEWEGVVSVKRYSVAGREIAAIEFSDLLKALTICEPLL